MPEPEPLPEAEASPAEVPPKPQGRQVPVSGWLGIAGGLCLVIGLIPAFYVNYDDSYSISTTVHGTQLYLLCLALLAMSAGQVTRLTAPRSPVGPGLLAGAALAACWGLHLFVMAGITLLADHSNAYLGGGFYLLIVGLVALVISGVGALRVIAPRFRRSGRPEFALLVVLGLICAFTVLGVSLDAHDQEADEMSVWSLKVTAAVFSILAPILAVNLLPRLFGLAMLGAWAVGCVGMFGIFARGMADFTYRTGLPLWLFGLAVAALVAGTLFVARKYRNEDQPIEGRSGP